MSGPPWVGRKDERNNRSQKMNTHRQTKLKKTWNRKEVCHFVYEREKMCILIN